MSSETLNEAGVAQDCLEAVAVVAQERMIDVLLKRESGGLVDSDQITLTGLETVMLSLPVERTKRSAPAPSSCGNALG
ncbi:hypothetical protein KR100_07860 [Synechococcus sp. KORDI-100]|uniref:hypothetical protein n=1 Tax=Synechococcus sp. KORDI-100 TaxID=1280380 RepID=UPI0004E09DA9|nr:hypothetical protein [Synechococcus sp. KORDI-100]AII43276.1 hypothetical protein KR100_07860 [Synechococcus sp. KORDI-100]